MVKTPSSKPLCVGYSITALRKNPQRRFCAGLSVLKGRKTTNDQIAFFGKKYLEVFTSHAGRQVELDTLFNFRRVGTFFCQIID
jgi:hypothetical protein